MLWVTARLLDLIDARMQDPAWPQTRPSGFAFAVAEVLQFLYAFLIIALIAYGLIKRSHFVWIAAFVWQVIEGGLGLVTLTLNDYELEAYTNLDGITLYGIVLPITLAIVSFMLLLLPATTRWIRGR